MTRPNREGRQYAQQVELRFHPSGRSATIVLDGKERKPLDSKQAVLNQLNQLSLNHRVRHRDFARMSLRVLQARYLCDTKREAAHARARANHDRFSSPVGVLFDGLNRDYGRPGQQSHGHRHVPIDTLGGARVPKNRGHGRDHRAHASQR